MRVLRFFRYAFGRFPLLLLLTTCVLVAVGVLEALALLSIAPVVDVVLGGEGGRFSEVSRRVTALLPMVGLPLTLGTLLAFFLAINLAKAAVQTLSVYAIVRAKYAILRDLMRGTFEDCLFARWEFFTSREQGALLNLFIRELMVVGDAFGGLARFVANVIHLSLYVAVPFYVSWQLTSASIAAALLLASPFVALGRVNYRLGRRNVDATNALGTVFQESFGAATVVLAYGNQRQSHERVVELRQAAREARQPTGNRRFDGFSRDIAFEDVSFTHPGRPPVLVDVNARIPKGKMVAFVGESGAGKSTLVDLLMGVSTHLSDHWRWVERRGQATPPRVAEDPGGSPIRPAMSLRRTSFRQRGFAAQSACGTAVRRGRRAVACVEI